MVGRHFVLTPTHTGAQPSLFKRGDREVRPLGPENDAGFRLVSALDEKQRKQAVIAERPQGELLLGPGRDGWRTRRCLRRGNGEPGDEEGDDDTGLAHHLPPPGCSSTTVRLVGRSQSAAVFWTSSGVTARRLGSMRFTAAASPSNSA